MLTQHNRKTARLSPDYTFAIRELGVWSGDETMHNGIHIKRMVVPCFSGCLQRANGNVAATRDQTQAIKPADWSVWSRDRFCKLQAT